jgi:membrane protease YdiL (CAAX protease family)
MQDQNIANPLAVRLLVALLIEAVFFLATGSERARAMLSALPPVRLATAMALLTLFTWWLGGGGEWWQGLAAAFVPALLAFWYLALPRNGISDVAFIAIYGCVALSKLSVQLYPAPWPKAPSAFVGELAWLRTFIVAFLLFRKPAGIGYGFLPSRQEWAAGIRWFLYLLPAVGAVAFFIGFAEVRTLTDPARAALSIVATFLGHFLFVALREELVFRGMLLPRLQEWVGSTAGIWITAILFGLAHLPARGFSNR